MNENFGATSGLFAKIKLWGPVTLELVIGWVFAFGISSKIIQMLPPDYFVGMGITFVNNLVFATYLCAPSLSNPGNNNLTMLLASITWLQTEKSYQSLDYNEFKDE